MATEKIYPKGINTFAKSEKTPDFVLGTIVINLNTFKIDTPSKIHAFLQQV